LTAHFCQPEQCHPKQFHPEQSHPEQCHTKQYHPEQCHSELVELLSKGCRSKGLPKGYRNGIQGLSKARWPERTPGLGAALCASKDRSFLIFLFHFFIKEKMKVGTDKMACEQ
jgi:hypothetical protein